MLLKTILESEDCEIDYFLEGQKVFDKLIEGLERNNPYDMIFTDNHMSSLSGSEVIKKYKIAESKHSIKKQIIAISVTDDPTMQDARITSI